MGKMYSRVYSDRLELYSQPHGNRVYCIRSPCIHAKAQPPGPQVTHSVRGIDLAFTRCSEYSGHCGAGVPEDKEAAIAAQMVSALAGWGIAGPKEGRAATLQEQGAGGAPPAEAYDAVVVGAGYAGLAAAHALVSAGKGVLVLEAAAHVGGRTRNYLPSDGAFDVAADGVVEVGGTFVSPSHTALISFAASMGVETYNTSRAGGTRHRRRPRARLRPAVAEPADLHPWWYWGVDDSRGESGESVLHTRSGGAIRYRGPGELRAKLKGLPVFEELEAVGATMAAAVRNLTCESADGVWRDADGITFEGWIRAHVTHEEGRDVLRAMNRGMVAQEPSQVSFLSTAKSLKGCWSGGDDDEYRLARGSQAPLLEAARRLGARLKLGAVVSAVTRRSGPAAPVSYDVATADGQVIRAKHVVLTGSPAALLGIRLPSLSANDAQLLQRMPLGESAKLFFFYREAWWRAAGKSGNVMATSGLSACMDHSSRDATTGSAALMCWLEGRTNLRFFGNANRTAALEEVVSFLEASLQDARARSYTSHLVLDWPAQPFARGAYTGFFPPGVQSQPSFWEAFVRQEKAAGLFVAGSDYYPGTGNGYMDGAVRSGEAAARAIARRP